MEMHGNWRPHGSDSFVFIVQLFSNEGDLLDQRVFPKKGVALIVPKGYPSNEQGALEYCHALWSLPKLPDRPF